MTKFRIFIIGATLSMAGCSSFLPKPAPAPTVYRLSPAQVNVPQSPTAMVVRIDRPNASNVFQTTNIVVSPDGRRLSAAGGSKWSETIPVLIQENFVDVLGQRETLVGVIPSSGARTNTRVHVTVKSFEAHFDRGESNPPLAVVHYAFTHSNASNRNLLGTFDIRKEVRASEARVSSIVDAMDRANSQALNAAADWLEGQALLTKS